MNESTQATRTTQSVTEESGQLQFAGINIGRGHVKLKTDRSYVQYASIVQRSQPSLDDLGFMRASTQRVVVEGVAYDVGEEVALVGERSSDKNVFSNWANSDLYRVLRQSVLDRLAQESAAPWAVMVGMPVTEFKDEPYRSLVTKLWEGQHKTATRTIRIERVATTPEPLGAFWHFVMTHTAREAELVGQNVVVIDFGYFTTDINAVNRMRLNWSIANSTRTGMRDVYRVMGDLINRKHRKVCSDIEIEMAVLGKWPLTIRGNLIDISEERRMAVDHVGERVMEWVRASVDRADGLVLVCGGGAPLFTPLVKKALPDAKVEMVAKPQEANAHGYWWMSQTMAETH